MQANKIFPCQPNCVAPYTEAASINNAGNLPRELPNKNTRNEILPMAAAKVIKPEGIYGMSRKENTR